MVFVHISLGKLFVPAPILLALLNSTNSLSGSLPREGRERLPRLDSISY
jgi:hypothetical protein